MDKQNADTVRTAWLSLGRPCSLAQPGGAVTSLELSLAVKGQRVLTPTLAPGARRGPTPALTRSTHSALFIPQPAPGSLLHCRL